MQPSLPGPAWFWNLPHWLIDAAYWNGTFFPYWAPVAVAALFLFVVFRKA